MTDHDAVEMLKYGILAFAIMLPLLIINYFLFSREALDSFLMAPFPSILMFGALTAAVPFLLDYKVPYLPAIHGLVRWGIVMVTVAIPFWNIFKISTLMFVELGIMMFGYVLSSKLFGYEESSSKNG